MRLFFKNIKTTQIVRNLEYGFEKDGIEFLSPLGYFSDFKWE
jgi:hypothetical protein